MKTYLSVAFLGLLLGSCVCPAPQNGDGGGGLAPQPGGDCVLNLNPDGNGFGPTFLIGYDLNGSAGTTTHMVKMSSATEAITVGTLGGTRETLTIGHLYDVVITSMEGPTVRLVDKTVTGNPDLFPEVTNITGADVRTGGFAVVPRGLESGGTAYTVIAIVAEVDDGMGGLVTRGIKFPVNE